MPIVLIPLYQTGTKDVLIECVAPDIFMLIFKNKYSLLRRIEYGYKYFSIIKARIVHFWGCHLVRISPKSSQNHPFRPLKVKARIINFDKESSVYLFIGWTIDV